MKKRIRNKKFTIGEISKIARIGYYTVWRDIQLLKSFTFDIVECPKLGVNSTKMEDRIS